jgi:hypothetical protein
MSNSEDVIIIVVVIIVLIGTFKFLKRKR